MYHFFVPHWSFSMSELAQVYQASRVRADRASRVKPAAKIYTQSVTSSRDDGRTRSCVCLLSV